MQPSTLDLQIARGATNKKPLWLMQPRFVSPSPEITEIHSTSPLRMTVPGHGLTDSWPVWVRGTGDSSLNREPGRQIFYMPDVIDADTLEFNAIDGADIRASGGRITYQLPVDLTGCTGRLLLCGPSSQLELTTENGGLEIVGLGRMMIVLTAGQSESITWNRGSYDLDLTMSDGDVLRWLSGSVIVSGGCNG